jgi:hypothetical protein
VPAIAAGVLFAVCQNLWFNFAGFLDHVRFIVGPGNGAYRVFDPNVAGHLGLLRLTVHLVRVSLGWPLSLIAVAGLILAAATPEKRRAAIWVALPAISYYFGFVAVILYNYDRFVLPICFILAIFGGLAIDASLKWSRSVPLTRAAIAAVFAYSLLYASTVDVLMMRDSRYTVQAWLGDHVRSDDVVAFTGVHEILPTLDNFKLVEIGTADELKRERPAYVVINADYVHAVAPESGWGQMLGGLQHGTLGYRLALRFRQPSPWPWLPGAHPDLVGSREDAMVFSTLQFVNPTIEVFQREPISAVDSTPQ